MWLLCLNFLFKHKLNWKTFHGVLYKRKFFSVVFLMFYIKYSIHKRFFVDSFIIIWCMISAEQKLLNTVRLAALFIPFVHDTFERSCIYQDYRFPIIFILKGEKGGSCDPSGTVRNYRNHRIQRSRNRFSPLVHSSNQQIPLSNILGTSFSHLSRRRLLKNVRPLYSNLWKLFSDPLVR